MKLSFDQLQQLDDTKLKHITDIIHQSISKKQQPALPSFQFDLVSDPLVEITDVRPSYFDRLGLRQLHSASPKNMRRASMNYFLDTNPFPEQRRLSNIFGRVAVIRPQAIIGQNVFGAHESPEQLEKVKTVDTAPPTPSIE